MKKLYILIFILIITDSLYAQQIQKKLLEVKILNTTLVYEALIKSNDTTFQTYIYGANDRYKNLYDRVIILFLNDTTQQQFLKDLIKAKEYVANGTTDGILFENPFYQIRVGLNIYGKNEISIYERRGRGYITQRLKDVEKLIEVLSSFHLGEWVLKN
jgi:hypothetical protein